MHYLVFVSTAGRLMSENETMAILNASLLRNSADGVTGMLIYKDDSVMPILVRPAGKRNFHGPNSNKELTYCVECSQDVSPGDRLRLPAKMLVGYAVGVTISVIAPV